MCHRKQRTGGFILPLAVIIVFSISAMMVRLMTRVTVLAPMERLALDREQAQQLALIGVTIVQAQLALPFKEEKEQQEFYKQLLTMLNSWKKFPLTTEVDGVDGTIELYVACEDGKVPLNSLWQFKEKKFAAPGGVDVKKLLSNVVFAGNESRKDLPVMERLEEFFKQQEGPLEDLTDLWTEKAFADLAESWLPKPTEEKGATKDTIFFGDFFTVVKSNATIQPLFFSAGVQRSLDVQQNMQPEKREELIDKLTKNIKEKNNWEQQWDQLLQPWYGITYNKVPQDAKKLFDDRVGASYISVVSYGNVGAITQKVLAFLSQNIDADGNVTYTIEKLGWW